MMLSRPRGLERGGPSSATAGGRWAHGESLFQMYDQRASKFRWEVAVFLSAIWTRYVSLILALLFILTAPGWIGYSAMAQKMNPSGMKASPNLLQAARPAAENLLVPGFLGPRLSGPASPGAPAAFIAPADVRLSGQLLSSLVEPVRDAVDSVRIAGTRIPLEAAHAGGMGLDAAVQGFGPARRRGELAALPALQPAGRLSFLGRPAPMGSSYALFSNRGGGANGVPGTGQSAGLPKTDAPPPTPSAEGSKWLDRANRAVWWLSKVILAGTGGLLAAKLVDQYVGWLHPAVGALFGFAAVYEAMGRIGAWLRQDASRNALGTPPLTSDGRRGPRSPA